MIDRIRGHVDSLFVKAPRTARAVELKEELIANLEERYTDLVQQGETEEAAFGIVAAGIGDVDDLIRGLREQELWDPLSIQLQRQRSALFVAIAVGLFIVSVIFPIIFVFLAEATGFEVYWVVGVALMLLCIAAGVALLVYNSRTKPQYMKQEETVVEEFKEWQSKKNNRKVLRRNIQSIIWTSSVPLYLCLGIFFNAWHPGWLIFLLAPVVSEITRLVFMHEEERDQ